MTVRELREALRYYDPHLPVFVRTQHSEEMLAVEVAKPVPLPVEKLEVVDDRRDPRYRISRLFGKPAILIDSGHTS